MSFHSSFAYHAYESDEYSEHSSDSFQFAASSIYKVSKAFSRDFLCCGLIHGDMHDLVRHFEEKHDRLNGALDILTLADASMLPPTLFWLPGSLAEDGKESCRAMKRNVDLMFSAKETMPCKKQKCDDDVLFDDLLSAIYDQEPETVSPSQVFRLPSVQKMPLVKQDPQPEPLQTPHISVGVASVNASGQVVQYGKVGRPPLVNEHGVVEKRYMCAVPGCGKIYKNPNGLKYHNDNGHLKEGELPKRTKKQEAVVEQETVLPPPTVIHEMDDDEIRPYICHIPSCNKAYKNSGGLKYHLERVHLDGCSASRKRQSQPQSAEFQRSVLEKASIIAAQAGIDVNTVEIPKKGINNRGNKTLTAAMAAALMQNFVSSMNG